MDELMTKDPVPLRRAALGDLPGTIARPDYDAAHLSPGIVHIGVGNFHRAHQAWYLHRLMQQGLARDWAIVGAGVRPDDAAMRDRLRAQDCLTTLIELGPDHSKAEVCGSMIDFLPVEPDNAALIAQMADPAIRIVSLTVTEGGYFVNPATGAFDPGHPDIAHDAANPATPRTAFGAIVAALRLRRDAGAGPFTVQSCDNLRGNGAITRDAVVGLARLGDPDLGDWIAAHCTFPNSMVDCIVPATGPAEIAAVRALGVDDAAPVTHENFRQWVIEDAFCAGRPDWDKVGATFSDNVHDYETMKIRILNAGHQVLANAGELLGVATIADCMAHPQIRPFWRRVEQDEIVPHVVPVPDMAPADYADLIETRFANPNIRDTTRRVAFDGSSRHAGFVLPVLREALAADAPVDGIALVEALWARMCAGTREDGSKIAANDPHWDALRAAAVAARDTPASWLAQTSIYGDLGQAPRFADAFDRWLRMIWDQGTAAALEAYARS
ncbi:mannitol dehydrogenase [Meridianimarinicoccus roseus]|uniref:Mannitol dehydrogenase n=2 Tax=Meridianimarinicoccus roseus TaxID=2072018 RepID=A0A2V2L7V3_9RHOB|nr:mannitol dehydrogenase [Meridianimarinicoccus roseus]